MPQKYKPTKLSELPKPRKIGPTKITNRTVYVCTEGNTCMYVIIIIVGVVDYIPDAFYCTYFAYVTVTL